MPAKARSHYTTHDYKRRAAAVRANANADPTTVCWRDGLTLAQHPPHRDGTPPVWQAGHTIDGDSSAPLAPEASTCNSSNGASAGNRKREPHSRIW